MLVKIFLLSIDLGNTHSKSALLDEDLNVLVDFDYKSLNEIIFQYGLNRENTIAGLSSVTHEKPILPFKTFFVSNYFKDSKFLNMPVHYSQTLGEDRLIQAWYLYSQFNKKMILIDTGTFTTIDFIDIKGLNGGFILPGLELLFETYQKGNNLKSYNNLYLENLSQRSIPNNTKDAIMAGAYLSYITPIREIISNNSDYEVYITGGNQHQITSSIENSHQLIRSPHLIHQSIGYFIQKVQDK